MLQLPASGRRKTSSRQPSGLQTREGGAPEKEVTEGTQDHNGKGVLSALTTPGVSFAASFRSSTDQQCPQARQVPAAGQTRPEKQSVPTPAPHEKTGQSVQTPHVNSQPLDNMLRVVTVVEQIMTEFNAAVSEEDKIVAITKIVLNLMKQNGH
jgi:hypothetical protein